MTTQLRPEVLIIGGGPAGLTAAANIATRLQAEVLVLDREQTAGGIPRHSDHPGYGIRDLHRFMSGPAYAEHLVRQAERAGATINTSAMVTHWSNGLTVAGTSPQGRFEVQPKAIIVATGARERPRTARRIPGTRPHGVYTTGQLQNLVHLHHRPVGERAVVVGGELVSWSAVVTLREAGCKTVLLVSSYPKVESYAAFNLFGRTVLRVPVATGAKVTRVLGSPRLEGLELEDIQTGQRRIVDCDTAVFSGDWIPDHELLRAAGIDLDPGTLGPVVDAGLRTSRQGVFAVGNLVHPVDTADVAALDGRHVADQVVSYVSDARWCEPAGTRIVGDPPLRWVAPNLLRPNEPAPSRNRLLAWTDAFRLRPRVTVVQDGTVLARRTLPWPAAPGRVFRIPASMLEAADRGGGDIHLQVT
jgi:thioredoxin reductase